MRKAKKLLSLALAAMMFVSAFSSTAFASDMDDAYEVDRVDGKYAVVRVEMMENTTIPNLPSPSPVRSTAARLPASATEIPPSLRVVVLRKISTFRIRLTSFQMALLRIPL